MMGIWCLIVGHDWKDEPIVQYHNYEIHECRRCYSRDLKVTEITDD